MTIEEICEREFEEAKRNGYPFRAFLNRLTGSVYISMSKEIDRAVAEHNEQCAKVADPGEWQDWMDVDDEAASAFQQSMRIMNDIRALLTPSVHQQEEKASVAASVPLRAP